MAKVETAERVAKRHAKETKELAKWQRVMAKPKPPYYLAVLMVVVAVVYIVDELSTNINTSMQSLILIDLFNITSRDVNSPEYANALTQVGSLGLLSMVFSFVSPFYKALADKYGRRIFLAINTVGMALGMLLVMIAPNLAVYILGVGILGFVTPNDVQTMYIMEVAPIKHRGKLCNIIKAIGILGISSVGLLRKIFVTDAIDSWRMVYLIPVIVAVVVGVLSVVFARETPVFLDERTAYLKLSLKLSDEERAERAKKGNDASKGGIGKAIKFIFKHKQLRNIAICGIVFIFTTVVTSYYESIMASTMSVNDISTAVMCYPFMYAAITVISGIVSDKLGRKRVCQIFGCVATLSLLGFILASKFVGNGVLCGLLYGAYVGGLWSTSDTLFFISSQESAPTELRASVVGTMSLIAFIGGTVSAILVIILQNFVDLGWLCFGITVPFMVAALILITFKFGETKNVDLNTVTGCEWD